MSSGLPLLAAFHKDLYHCSDCNYCVDAVWRERGLTHVCPTMSSHTPLVSYSGRGYIAAARAWHEGATLDLAALGERVFTCTTCNHCETVCPIGLRPTQVGRALRGELWTRDEIPAPVRALREAFARDGNPNGVPRADRSRWETEATSATVAASRGTVRYLPGCAAATGVPAEAVAAVALMRCAGFAVTTLGSADSCCGAPLFELGLDDEATFMRDALAAKCTAPMVTVTSGLECARSWARATDATLAPERLVCWLRDRLADGSLVLRLRAGAPREVAIVDSCQVRDVPDAAAALREILSALGVASAPTASAPKHVVCCGAAGGLARMAPESAQRMATARAAAEAVHVSADPRCVAHLRASGVTVFGIAEFLQTQCESPT